MGLWVATVKLINGFPDPQKFGPVGCPGGTKNYPQIPKMRPTRQLDNNKTSNPKNNCKYSEKSVLQN